MDTIVYCTVAFLTCYGNTPKLEIKGEIPKKYSKVIVKDYTTGKVIEPDGFDEAVLPYFSDKFYQKRMEKREKFIKFDKESAGNLFWFLVDFLDYCT